MEYIEINIVIPDGIAGGREMATAMLFDYGVDSILETDNGLLIYFPVESFDIDDFSNNRLFHVDGAFGFTFTTRVVPDINWNEAWEKSFNPVIINNQVAVRAPFHPRPEGVDYDIVIEPRMAFGTGHHESTELMISQMLRFSFQGKRTLDIGCGTGILAILASMMGSSNVAAVDNDPVATENCSHNLSVNGIVNVNTHTGTATDAYLTGKKFDIILANINRNVLTENMPAFSDRLVNGGIILLSGYYSGDMPAIEKAARGSGLNRSSFIEKNQWICEAYMKP